MKEFALLGLLVVLLVVNLTPIALEWGWSLKTVAWYVVTFIWLAVFDKATGRALEKLKQ